MLCKPATYLLQLPWQNTIISVWPPVYSARILDTFKFIPEKLWETNIFLIYILVVGLSIQYLLISMQMIDDYLSYMICSKLEMRGACLYDTMSQINRQCEFCARSTKGPCGLPIVLGERVSLMTIATVIRFAYFGINFIGNT